MGDNMDSLAVGEPTVCLYHLGLIQSAAGHSDIRTSTFTY